MAKKCNYQGLETSCTKPHNPKSGQNTAGFSRQMRSYYGSSRLDAWAAAEIQAQASLGTGFSFLFVFAN